MGNLVFWFGASYLTETYLNSSTTQEMWFLFWAAVIVLFGVSLIARAIVLFARKAIRQRIEANHTKAYIPRGNYLFPGCHFSYKT
jgi:hypothetical protein